MTLGIKEQPSESRPDGATQDNPPDNNFDNSPHLNRPQTTQRTPSQAEIAT
jgi:hypothetical protein